MQNGLASTLLAFLRRNGNLLPISVRYGEGYSLSKLYRRIDKRGEGCGTPHLDITVDALSRCGAEAALGTEPLQVRDGELFLLAAEHRATLPGGYDVFEYFGIRTGIWHVQPETGYAVSMPDGERFHAKTIEGVRRKLVAGLLDRVARLKRVNLLRGEAPGKEALDASTGT